MEPRTEAGQQFEADLIEWEEQEYGTESTAAADRHFGQRLAAIEAEARAQVIAELRAGVAKALRTWWETPTIRTGDVPWKGGWRDDEEAERLLALIDKLEGNEE